MDATEVPIAESKQFRTYQQLVRPESLDDLVMFFRAMDAEMRAKKFNGRVTIDFNCGGRRRILAEEIEMELLDEN